MTEQQPVEAGPDPGDAMARFSEAVRLVGREMSGAGAAIAGMWSHPASSLLSDLAEVVRRLEEQQRHEQWQRSATDTRSPWNLNAAGDGEVGPAESPRDRALRVRREQSTGPAGRRLDGRRVRR